MAERWQDEPWARDLWWRGKTTRRRFLSLSAAAAGAVGATRLVPPPGRAAFGQAKPYKIGVLQPLSGVAAAGGKTALVGTQVAAERINKSGGINGRPVELVIADYESKPDVGRRKAEKLVVEDKVDLAEGGYLSNVCLACMPVFEEHRTVWMIGVCLDTTITTTKCSRFVFRPFDYAPAQAVAISPYLVKKMGKKWHIAFLDYAWGQSTRDAYIDEIKKNGDQAVAALKQIDPSGPLPDRYVQSNFEAMNFLKLGIQKSGFRNRENTMKLIEALEGMEVKEGDDFPQGDKTLRKEDHQAFLREFIFDIKDNRHRIVEVIAKEKTIFPPACKFA